MAMASRERVDRVPWCELAVDRDLARRLMGWGEPRAEGMGTPADVEKEVRYLIDHVGPGGGYILSSGNSLAACVLPENARAMAAAAERAHGAYAA